MYRKAWNILTKIQKFIHHLLSLNLHSRALKTVLKNLDNTNEHKL